MYLAIAKNQVIGVCVAQPLSQAHRLISENGLDFCSIQIYTVKWVTNAFDALKLFRSLFSVYWFITILFISCRCGISRIWVAPPYRRYGVASRLITCVRGNFIFGKYLSIDEIAFSSPTEDGKRFASKLCQREDFLIYDGWRSHQTNRINQIHFNIQWIEDNSSASPMFTRKSLTWFQF